ncbi:hypothetical protein [Actinophytocola xinjiangensis]|uniref:hypothetical protein n=1 Tax=Actinophytocola xinjiangensis TaxID=485602 RepID=UPI000B0E910A|nr:hypothetical protein [Actinophytocola xinjiangensis]
MAWQESGRDVTVVVMTRSWKDVKAEKARRDQANGRDIDAARDVCLGLVVCAGVGVR